ncbi:MAG TPA: hypothetical protein VFP47_15740 [Pyrinomonadaceae bacterium]|nr:hypothetical protein [Pyrinomonadaceae bacterium]
MCEFIWPETSTFREFPKRRNVSSGNTSVDVTVIVRFTGLTEVAPVCAGAGWASFHHRLENFAERLLQIRIKRQGLTTVA